MAGPYPGSARAPRHLAMLGPPVPGQPERALAWQVLAAVALGLGPAPGPPEPLRLVAPPRCQSPGKSVPNLSVACPSDAE